MSHTKNTPCSAITAQPHASPGVVPFLAILQACTQELFTWGDSLLELTTQRISKAELSVGIRSPSKHDAFYSSDDGVVGSAHHLSHRLCESLHRNRFVAVIQNTA